MSTPQLIDKLRPLTPFIDDWLAFQRWYLQVPGIAAGMSVGDQTVFVSAHGMADVEAQQPMQATTRFRVASHSKLFTATAVMQLVEQGRMGLDDAVVDHVPWFRAEERPDLSHVTVRQLLAHSSGLTRDGGTTHWHDDRFPSIAELEAQVGSMPVYGTVEHLKYSNIGFTLAGQVIEAVTGRSYEEHVSESLIEPLGLGSTTPDLPDDLTDHARGYPRWLPDRDRPAFDHAQAGAMNSATGFSSTVDDLLRWYQAHRFGSGELLADHTKREMQRVQFEHQTGQRGLGFGINTFGGLRFVGHGGGYPGFITYSALEQKHGIAIVVLTNAADGPAQALVEGIAKLARHALNGAFVGTPRFAAETVDDVAGFYEHRWAIKQVARIGSKVVTTDAVELDPTAKLSVLEHVDGLSFRYPTTYPSASPGEIVRFEPGPPPRLHDPAAPPVERATLWD